VIWRSPRTTHVHRVELFGIAALIGDPFPFEQWFQGKKWVRLTDPEDLTSAEGIGTLLVLKKDGYTGVYALDSPLTKVDVDSFLNAHLASPSTSPKEANSSADSAPKKKKKEPSAKAAGKKEDKPKKASSPQPEKVQEKGEGPLHVKGLPRSKDLSEGQINALRKFFKIEESSKVDPDVWAKMSNKDKSAHRKAHSIPRWAVAAVKDKPTNLDRIISGELTKTNFVGSRSGPATGAPPKKDVSQASQKWLEVRDTFKGVQLLRRPQTQREKHYKKAYDALIKEYGYQKCFPRPKDGRRASDPGPSAPKSPTAKTQGPSKLARILALLLDG